MIALISHLQNLDLLKFVPFVYESGEPYSESKCTLQKQFGDIWLSVFIAASYSVDILTGDHELIKFYADAEATQNTENGSVVLLDQEDLKEYINNPL